MEEPDIGMLTICYSWIFHCTDCHVQGSAAFEFCTKYYIVDASKEFAKTAKDGKRATKLCCCQKRKENIPEFKTRKVFWFYFTLRCEEIVNE